MGPRWLAYASNNPLQSNTGRLSPQSLTPPGVSPSTSPSSGNLVARYAMESSKHLAAGLINLGDMGYKTLSKYYQEYVPDGSNSPLSSNSNRKVGRLHSTETDAAGMVSLFIQDFLIFCIYIFTIVILIKILYLLLIFLEAVKYKKNDISKYLFSYLIIIYTHFWNLDPLNNFSLFITSTWSCFLLKKKGNVYFTKAYQCL